MSQTHIGYVGGNSVFLPQLKLYIFSRSLADVLVCHQKATCLKWRQVDCELGRETCLSVVNIICRNLTLMLTCMIDT